MVSGRGRGAGLGGVDGDLLAAGGRAAGEGATREGGLTHGGGRGRGGGRSGKSEEGDGEGHGGSRDPLFHVRPRSFYSGG